MDSLSNPVNILILASSEEEAEAIITSLRNGGLAVRGIFTDEPERLDELTGTYPFDLIFCCEYDPAIDLDTCMSYFGELDLDLPLIVIAGEETDSPSLIRALRAGARDLTEHRDTEHLQLVVARELSDLRHRRMEQRLRQRLEDCEKRDKDVIDASGDAVAFVQGGMHVQANPAYQRLFQFATLEDLDGYPLLDLISPDEQPEARRILRSLEQQQEKESNQMELQCMRADTSHFHARVTASRSNLDGEPCLRITVEEIQQEKPHEVTGHLDSETGLPNRTALKAELSARVEQGNSMRRPFAAFYIGLTALSKVLHNHGLITGMEAAATFGEALRELAPKGSFLARMGDDAFVLLVEDLTRSDAMQLVSKITNKAHLPLSKKKVDDDKPSCSVGLMIVDPRIDSPTDILNTVYRDFLFGLLESKQAQSTTGFSAAPDSDPHSESGDQDRRLTARITRALDGDGFQLFYQPIVSLKGDSQENYNVLLRLREHDRSLREAKEFLSAAIQSGRMVAVDRWVIRRAIAQVASKRSQGQKINFFVNLAEETIQEDNLLIWICNYLEEFQARGNWLTFQILEEHARRHSAAFTKLGNGLKKVKCRVALNRFGLGPDPELLLRSLSADFVKFAPELSKDLADDNSKQQRLLDLAHLAREIGVRSVITGVEDARSLTVLWTAGVDYVQGNFLQEPTEAIETAEQPD